MARGLLEDDTEWDRCLAEAIKVKMPRQLRNLFCTICVFSNPTEPLKLFEKYQNHFIEDFVHKLKCTKENAINLCLNEFEKFFLTHQLSCAHFQLPTPKEIIETETEKIDFNQEKKLGNNMKKKLNSDQNEIVEKILNASNTITSDKKLFFIKAPGGCGKTFIYNTITHILRGEAKKVLSVAWTGIASTLLIDGRTVHNAFQIPLDLHEDSRSNMPTQSSKAKYLREVDVIIWDEVIVLD
jgi:hypothetical protein